MCLKGWESGMSYELTIAVYRWGPLVLAVLAVGLVVASCGHGSFDDFVNG